MGIICILQLQRGGEIYAWKFLENSMRFFASCRINFFHYYSIFLLHFTSDEIVSGSDILWECMRTVVTVIRRLECFDY